jgi:DNA invertase Pin-like site-specific DNA recombinase
VAFNEDVGSGKDLRRPGIRAALEALSRGEADALVIAKLDRLSRSMLDFANIMALAQKQSWALVALDVNVDTTTPAGEAMANVVATFAQFERRLISQRTREALAVKKAQGVRLGRPRQMTDDAIETIMYLNASGLTMREIISELDLRGIPTARGGKWSTSTISQVIHRERQQAIRTSNSGTA